MYVRGHTRAARRRWFWLALGLAILLVSGLTGSAMSAPAAGVKDKPAKTKPAKPAKANPSKKGLVTAVDGRLTVAGDTSQAAAAGVTSGDGIPGAVGTRTLVLYDTTGEYGWLGELYAIATANLASHFGPWTARPVASYQPGDMSQFDAVVYIGSTYDEPLPPAFLDDVYASTTPVIWVYDNIWQLTARFPEFETAYGWMWSQFDLSSVSTVSYKGVELTRDAENNGAGIMSYWDVDPMVATVLGDAVRDDGTRFPWALRSGNLTYVGENPYVYVSETDRLLAFEDLLFDTLDPTAPTRHRAIVRLEDLSPATDVAEVRAVVDYLAAQGIPFGFSIASSYRDPLAVENPRATTLPLAGSDLAQLVTYMQAHGGTSVMHGYTHQYDATRNPYTGVTGDDFEFYRVTEAADHSLVLEGPVAEDSDAWALGRLDAAAAEFRAAQLAVPQIFVMPHYTGSSVDYAAVTTRVGTRWERALYYGGTLASGTIDYGKVIGQLFPFVVRDVYGSLVLPENVGDYEPEPFYTFPAHTVADILAAADANTVVRDGFAAVYYHPFNGVEPLRQIVEGLRAGGWTSVSPADLAGIVEQGRPVNLETPVVSGVAAIGQVLTTTTGTWQAVPAVTSVTYRWLRCDATGGSAACRSPGRRLRPTRCSRPTRARRCARRSARRTRSAPPPPRAPRPPSCRRDAARQHGAAGDLRNPSRRADALVQHRNLDLRDADHVVRVPVAQVHRHGRQRHGHPRRDEVDVQVQKADVGRKLRVRVTARNAVGSTAATSNATAVVTK